MYNILVQRFLSPTVRLAPVYLCDFTGFRTLLIVAPLLLLPCFGTLVVFIWLGGLVFGIELREAFLNAILLVIILFGELMHKISDRFSTGSLIVLIIVLMILYEFVVVDLLKGIKGFIDWSADWLSQGEARRRQLGYASLLAVFGAIGLVISVRAPDLEEIAAIRLTPTPYPTLPPVPTSTPPFILLAHDFSGRDLSGTILDDAILRGANFTGANLDHASLLRADLRYARLVRANLEGANLEGADLRDTDITGANLRYAHLNEAQLSGIDLRYAKLPFANLTGVDFSGLDMRGANLEGALLTNANLRESDLTGANLRDTYLSGSDLTDAHVTLAQIVDCHLAGAIMLDGTRYDGRFHTSANDAELDYLLEYDGLDPSETLDLGDYLRHFGVSKEIWFAGQTWARENLAALQAEADAWYAEHWPDD